MSLITAANLAMLFDGCPTVNVEYRGRVVRALYQRNDLAVLEGDSRAAGNYSCTLTLEADSVTENPTPGDVLTLSRDGRATITYAVERVEPLANFLAWKLYCRESS